MPTLDRVVEQIQLFKGQKSGAPPQSIQAADSALAQNCILLQNQLKKVNGTSIYARLETTATSQTVPWLDYFNGKWYAQKSSKIFRETGTASKAFDNYTLDSSTRLFSDKYAGSMFMCSGDHLYRWNETGTFAKQTWGLLPKVGATLANANVTTSNGAGTLTPNTTYYWTISLYDEVSGTESPAHNSRPGFNGFFLLDPLGGTPLSPSYWTKTTGAADDTATFTFAEIQAQITGTYVDSRATHFRFYRTDTNGDAFKLVTTLTYGAGSSADAINGPGTIQIADFIAKGSDLVDTTGDDDLGLILNTVSNSPPPSVDRMQEAYLQVKGVTLAATNWSTYKHIRAFRDSIFAIGASGVGISGTDSAAFGKFSSILYVHEPFEPEIVATTFNLNDGDGQLGTAVAILKDQTLVAFKEHSIYYLLGTSPDNYQVRIMDSKRGCVHASTIQETPQGIFALDASGIILVDGIGWAKPLSNPDINDVIQRVNFRYASNAYSSYDFINEVYYLSLPVDGASQPNLTIAYSLRSNGFTVGEGVEGNSLRFDYDPNNVPLAMIGARQQGLLLDWSSERQTTFISNPIQMRWRSGPCYLGDPTKKKKVRFLYLTAEAAQDFTIDINIIADFGQTPAYRLTAVNSASIFSVYAASAADSGANVGIWDESEWGEAKTIKQVKIPIYGVAYAFQIEIIHKESSAAKYGFKLMAAELEGVMMGK